MWWSHFPLSCIFVLDEIDFGKKNKQDYNIYILYIYTMWLITNNSPFEECIVQKQIRGCSSRASNMDWFSEQQRVIARLQWLDGFVRFWEQVVRRSQLQSPNCQFRYLPDIYCRFKRLDMIFVPPFSRATELGAQLGLSWSSWRIISGKSYSDVNIEETPFQKGNEW